MKVKIVSDTTLIYSTNAIKELFINFELPSGCEIVTRNKTECLLNRANHLVASIRNKYKHKSYNDYKLKLTVILILYSSVSADDLRSLGSASNLYDKITLDETVSFDEKDTDALYEVIDNIYNSIPLEKVDILHLFRNKAKLISYCDKFFESINNEDAVLFTKVVALEKVKEFLLEPKNIIERLFKGNNKLIQEIRSFVFSVDLNNPVNSGQHYNNEINTYVLLGLIVNKIAKNKNERFNKDLALTRCFYLTHLFRNLDLLEKGDTTSLKIVLNYISLIDIREKFIIDENDCRILENYITRSEKFLQSVCKPLHHKHFKSIVMASPENFLSVFLEVEQEEEDLEKLYFDKLLENSKIDVKEKMPVRDTTISASRKLELNYNKDELLMETRNSVLVDKYMEKIIGNFRVPIKYLRDTEVGLERDLKSLQIIVSSFKTLNKDVTDEKARVMYYTLVKVMTKINHNKNHKKILASIKFKNMTFENVPRLVNKNNEIVYDILNELSRRIDLYRYNFSFHLELSNGLYDVVNSFYYELENLNKYEIIIKPDFVNTILNFNNKIKVDFDRFVDENKNLLFAINDKLFKNMKHREHLQPLINIVSYLLFKDTRFRNEYINSSEFLNCCMFIALNQYKSENKLSEDMIIKLHRVLVSSRLYDKFSMSAQDYVALKEYLEVYKSFVPSTINNYDKLREYYNTNMCSFYNRIERYENLKKSLEKEKSDYLVKAIKQEFKTISSNIKNDESRKTKKLRLSENAVNPDVSVLDFK